MKINKQIKRCKILINKLVHNRNILTNDFRFNTTFIDETKKEYSIVKRDKAKGIFENEFIEDSGIEYYLDEISRDLEELDDKEANEYLEDLAKAILKLKR